MKVAIGCRLDPELLPDSRPCASVETGAAVADLAYRQTQESGDRPHIGHLLAALR